MERLKHIKDCLMACIEGQMSHLDTVDAEELGEAIDCLKDITEAIYYCTVTKAMEEAGEEGGPRYYTEKSGHTDWRDNPRHYSERPYYYGPHEYYNREMGGDHQKMYYGQGDGSTSSSSGANNSSTRYYSEREMMMPEMRDRREGRSPQSRRMYMESKEMHKGQDAKLRDLENYMQELTTDITEMIHDASPEEKQLLQKKIATLASKIEV